MNTLDTKLARIIAFGTYLPEKVLTNQELEKMVETSDEWIVTRTGMKERRIAASDEKASDMGTAAGRKALENAGLRADQIDLILVATMTPDYFTPSTAALIQAALGAKQAAAFDLSAACAGFLYGLSMAKAFIESGQYRTILLIATEKMSSQIDYSDRNTCVLFGDGASAVVITREGEGLLIENVCLGADGGCADLLVSPCQSEKKYLTMNGRELFKHAVRRMDQAARESLAKADLSESDISWVIPHQANARIIDALVKNFNMPSERVYKTLHKYGNTSASSIGIALEELTHQETIQTNEHLLLVAFGAGLAWGASILTKT